MFSIAQPILCGSSVFWFGSWWVPGFSGRAPEAPETPRDGPGWPPGAPGVPGARVKKPKSPYFLLGPTRRPRFPIRQCRASSSPRAILGESRKVGFLLVVSIAIREWFQNEVVL